MEMRISAYAIPIGYEKKVGWLAEPPGIRR